MTLDHGSLYIPCSVTARHRHLYHHGFNGSMRLPLRRKCQPDLVITSTVMKRSDEHTYTTSCFAIVVAEKRKTEYKNYLARQRETKRPEKRERKNRHTLWIIFLVFCSSNTCFARRSCLHSCVSSVRFFCWAQTKMGAASFGYLHIVVAGIQRWSLHRSVSQPTSFFSFFYPASTPTVDLSVWVFSTQSESVADLLLIHFLFLTKASAAVMIWISRTYLFFLLVSRLSYVFLSFRPSRGGQVTDGDVCIWTWQKGLLHSERWRCLSLPPTRQDLTQGILHSDWRLDRT